jgi:hypothetical protein
VSTVPNSFPPNTMPTTSNVTTFLLLADPQEGDAGSSDPSAKQKVENGSVLAKALNNLINESYPANGGAIQITCSGPIGRPNCVFFAGDLTQYGGNYNGSEQSNIVKYNPSNYEGGGQLQDLRALYDPWHPRSGVTQLSECGPLYFGLGNHGMILKRTTRDPHSLPITQFA